MINTGNNNPKVGAIFSAAQFKASWSTPVNIDDGVTYNILQIMNANGVNGIEKSIAADQRLRFDSSTNINNQIVSVLSPNYGNRYIEINAQVSLEVNPARNNHAYRIVPLRGDGSTVDARSQIWTINRDNAADTRVTFNLFTLAYGSDDPYYDLGFSLGLQALDRDVDLVNGISIDIRAIIQQEGG